MRTTQRRFGERHSTSGGLVFDYQNTEIVIAMQLNKVQLERVYKIKGSTPKHMDI